MVERRKPYMNIPDVWYASDVVITWVIMIGVGFILGYLSNQLVRIFKEENKNFGKIEPKQIKEEY